MLCTQESPCDVSKDWLPDAGQALDKAMRQKQKCKAAVAAKRAHDMEDSIEIHAPQDGLPPIKQREDGSFRQKDSAKRAKTATSSTSKTTEAKTADRPSRSRDKKSKTVSSSVSVVGRSSRSDGPSGTKGSESHRSHSGERGCRDRSHGAERRHDSPRYCHSPRGRENEERARPTSSSGGSSSRSKQADLTDLPGSGRASGRAMDVRPSSTHHRHHHGRRESVDKDKSGSFHVSRCDVELSPLVPQPPERRTITVIQSPPRPAGRDDSAGVTGLTDSAEVVDSAGVTGQTDSAENHDSAGDESAGDHNSAGGDEPEVVDDSAGVADPAHEEDLEGVADSADRQDSTVDDSARGDGPVAQGTPAGNTPARVFTPDQQGQDTTMVSEASSLLFPSLPRPAYLT